MTSTIISNVTQIDGRKSITERHIDDNGKEHIILYLAEVGADVNALLTAHGQQIADSVAPQYSITNEDGTVIQI